MIDITALIILLIFPVQSMSIDDDFAKLPTSHKRWTFNTWRLYGRRQLPKGLIFLVKQCIYLLVHFSNRFLFTQGTIFTFS